MASKEENNKKKWKQDFPYHKQNSDLVNRREFAKMLTFVSGGLTFGTGLVAAKANLFPKKKVEGEHLVCAKSEVPIGGTRSFTVKDSDIPYILVHLENGSFRAYEQKCTHLSCSVYYEPGTGHIICPCHKGVFDANDGAVLAGPPPRKLPKLSVIERDGSIYIAAEEEKSTI